MSASSIDPSGAVAPIAPQILTDNCPPTSTDLASCGEAALFWYRVGFQVMPTAPNTKVPAVMWDPWLAGLSPEAIRSYWSKYPGHQLGFIVGVDTIVFDADSPASIAALADIEDAFNSVPKLVVKTAKGEHHYYRRGKGSRARSDAHSTEKHPERIDIKTGRALVILPPSTGKTVAIWKAGNASELSEASQDFIDAIFRHNGRTPVRPSVIALPSEISLPSSTRAENTSQMLAWLTALVGHIDANIGYEDWIRVLMAIFRESGGSDEGLALADAWSSKGSNYKGRSEIEAKWRSFKADVENPITIGTIFKMVKDNGGDWMEICSATEPWSEPFETETIYPGELPTEPKKRVGNALDQYSLRGRSAELEKHAVEQVPVLGQLALKGQATILYAAPNTGKTLITLALLIEAIKSHRIDPLSVYYLNMDDTSTGLAEKSRIADEYGFNVLADGKQGFTAGAFKSVVEDLVASDKCKGVIVVLDTLKKFVDLMDKKGSSGFTTVIRLFILKGGTVIGLAHTNKMPGQDGKPIYGGTSDFMDDFDCGYILRTISSQGGKRVVEFENKKNRGNVAPSASYSYSTERGSSYGEILASVELVDDMELAPLNQAEAIKSDAAAIGAVEACIREGTNAKMLLADAVAKRAGCSKRIAIQILEKYTGDNPAYHKWKFTVGPRGAKVFALLTPTLPV